MINIGEMNIDDYGRADISYEYPVNNISNSGISIDKVSGAAVVRILDNNIISVMSGFASMEVPEWKSFGIIKDKAKVNSKPKSKPDESTKDKKDNKKAKESENKSIFDKYEENIEAKKNKDKEVKGNTEPDNIKDNKKKDDKKKNEPDKKKKDEDIKKEDNNNSKQKSEQLTNKIADLVENKHKEELKRIKDEHINEDIDADESKEVEDQEEEIYVDNSSMEIQEEYRQHENESSKDNFFESLVEGFKETSNVSKELKRCKWYKVPAASIQDMNDMTNYNKYTFVYYPMTSYYNYIENYSHFLLGYKYDKKGNVKYIVYGIPGTKNKQEQPYGGRSGFVTWVPQKSKNKLGYWLMFYDFRTGTVDIPVKDNNI